MSEEKQKSEVAPASSAASVRSYLDELVEFGAEAEHLRKTLQSKGLKRADINALLAAINGPEDNFEALLNSSMAVLEHQEGSGVIDADTLKFKIRQLHEFEEDDVSLRRAASREGLNGRILNQLAMIIRANPGDKGSAEVSTLLDYALRYGIDVKGFEHDQKAAPSSSVIPVVPRRREQSDAMSRKRLLSDLVIGSLLGLVLIRLLGV